ncbi:hypothetical protein SAMN05660284_00682 [Formivibrio citricus]|uniref:Uncharacterized protein n=1 Tax=Formivibrio citricus TaxID=83765 RepID=A0A1I4WSB2_9NEIS|nr:hypothetical protein [Formivibrio citricus]SFN15980.1 hypothetical protein SAMN05660284_00682 [Formivibrio citricus]
MHRSLVCLLVSGLLTACGFSHSKERSVPKLDEIRANLAFA